MLWRLAHFSTEVVISERVTELWSVRSECSINTWKMHGTDSVGDVQRYWQLEALLACPPQLEQQRFNPTWNETTANADQLQQKWRLNTSVNTKALPSKSTLLPKLLKPIPQKDEVQFDCKCYVRVEMIVDPFCSLVIDGMTPCFSLYVHLLLFSPRNECIHADDV
jgi:hypothetical protein